MVHGLKLILRHSPDMRPICIFFSSESYGIVILFPPHPLWIWWIFVFMSPICCAPFSRHFNCNYDWWLGELLVKQLISSVYNCKQITFRYYLHLYPIIMNENGGWCTTITPCSRSTVSPCSHSTVSPYSHSTVSPCSHSSLLQKSWHFIHNSPA